MRLSENMPQPEEQRQIVVERSDDEKEEKSYHDSVRRTLIQWDFSLRGKKLSLLPIPKIWSWLIYRRENFPYLSFILSTPA